MKKFQAVSIYRIPKKNFGNLRAEYLPDSNYLLINGDISKLQDNQDDQAQPSERVGELDNRPRAVQNGMSQAEYDTWIFLADKPGGAEDYTFVIKQIDLTHWLDQLITRRIQAFASKVEAEVIDNDKNLGEDYDDIDEHLKIVGADELRFQQREALARILQAEISGQEGKKS